MPKNSSYMDNPVIRWTFKQTVKKWTGIELNDEDIDPADSWKEARDHFEEQFGKSLSPVDDRPIGPDGKICKEVKYCANPNCGEMIVNYDRNTKKYHSERCKMQHHRMKKRMHQADPGVL